MALELSICPVCLRTHIASGIHQCETIGVSTGYTTSSNTSCAMCYLHVSALPCPWCAEAASQASRDRFLSDFQKRVQEKINALYPEQPSQQEEPLADNIDRTLLAKLEAMRAARDEAVRYAQTLNDEAALHRIEDERLTAQASRIIDQVNEGTPVPEDS